MAITTFIPELWSARLIEHLRKATVYANLFNRDYEGEIAAYGDTVHLTSLNEVAIKSYTRNTDIADPDQLTTVDQTLLIDQGDYFNFYLNDVDRAQSANGGALMDGAMQSASYGLAAKVDTFCAGLLAAGGTITTGLGTATTPLQITSANAYSTLVDIRTKLDKADVPKTGRWIVMPPEFEGYMLMDNRFVMNGMQSGDEALKNGYVGRAAGFDIYTSNNVPNTSNAKYKICAGTKMGATFAEQILNTEAYRREKGFDDGVKGLHVYGAKVTMPGAYAVAICNFGAGT